MECTSSKECTTRWHYRVLICSIMAVVTFPPKAHARVRVEESTVEKGAILSEKAVKILPDP
jgi:hypothetical protein